jgi:hypothetical protein
MYSYYGDMIGEIPSLHFIATGAEEASNP